MTENGVPTADKISRLRSLAFAPLEMTENGRAPLEMTKDGTPSLEMTVSFCHFERSAKRVVEKS